MPTLMWIHRSKGSTSADIGGSSALSGRSEEAVPDTSTAVFSSASVVPAVSSKQSAEARSDADILVDFQRLIEARPDAGQKRKRKMSPSANAAMAAEKKCKAASERDLPTGVYKALSGKRFVSRIKWGRKQRYIGTFDTTEQASAAYVSVKKDLGNIELSALGADEINAAFDAVKKRALESVGGFNQIKKRPKVTSERDLPKGVQRSLSGKRFESKIHWGGTSRYIGTFDSPEQASAAHVLMRKERGDIEISALGADEVNASFDAAKKKALEAVGGFMPSKRARTSELDLPTGVQKIPSGKFQAKIQWGRKKRGIGTFDTPEQASAAYVSVKKDLVEGANLPAGGADKANDLFDAARKRVFIPRTKGAKTNSERGLPTGVCKQPWGKFYSRIQWGGKTRYIGTFDTPEQASAAYVSVKKDLGDIELSALGADEINAAFDAVKREHWRQ